MNTNHGFLFFCPAEICTRRERARSYPDKQIALVLVKPHFTFTKNKFSNTKYNTATTFKELVYK